MKNFSLNLFIFFLLFPFIVSAQIVLPAYQGIQNKNNVVSYTGYSSTGFEGKTPPQFEKILKARSYHKLKFEDLK